MKALGQTDLQWDDDAEEQRFLARALVVCTSVLLALIVVATLVAWLRGVPWRTVANMGPMAAAALVLLLQRHIKPQHGWLLFLCLVVPVSVFNVMTEGGLFAPYIVGLMFMVLITGRMIGVRWAIGGVLGLCALLFLLAHWHTRDGMQLAALVGDPYKHALMLMRQFLAMAVLSWFLLRIGQQRMRRLRQARAEAEAHAVAAARHRSQFESVFRSSPMAMAIVRESDRAITDCNQAFLALLGLAREAVLGQPCDRWGLNLPVHGVLQATEHTGPVASACRLVLHNTDGGHHECEVRMVPLEGDTSADGHVMLHLTDQTERLQYERALLASEQRFHDFAQASGDWFWETDAQGRFVWMSDTVETITDLPMNSHLGKTLAEMAWLDTDQRAADWVTYEATVARRQPYRDFRYARGSPAGRHWFSTSGLPRLSASGEFMGYRGVGVDITDQVQAQEQAEVARVRLEAAVEELNEAFVMCDVHDRIVVTNRKFREQNPGVLHLIEQGCTFEQCLRASCEQGAYGPLSMSIDAFVRERTEQRRRNREPFEWQRSDGGWSLVREMRLPDGCIVTMALDITAHKLHERQMAESEARLRATLDHAPGVAIQEYDLTGQVMYWNCESENLFGISRGDALGRSLVQLIGSPEQAAEWLDVLHQTAQRDGPFGPVKATLVRKDGARRTILYSSYAVPNPTSGKRVVCMVVDIGEQERVQEQLRESKRLLEQVINAIPMNIFVKDANSNYVMVNKHFLAFFRMQPHELSRLNTMTLPAPEATRRQSLLDDQLVYRTRQVLDQPDITLQDADGNWVSFHSLKIPLIGDDGVVTGLLGINRDIRAEKLAQEALRQSESRFSTLFHRSPVPQVVTGLNTLEVEDVNQAFLDLTGLGRDQIVGPADPSNTAIWDQTSRELVRSVSLTETEHATIEFSIRGREGQRRTVLAAAVRINTASGQKYVWAFEDVTDQRAAQKQTRELNQTLERLVQQRTEQLTRANADLQTALLDLEASRDALLQAEKLAALGRIVAAVAHELNTPIGNGLLAATTLSHRVESFVREVEQGLRRSQLEQFVASSREAASILQRNLERAAELVRSFKQVAVDRTSAQRRLFDLRAVVQEVVLSMAPAVRRNKVQVQVDVATGIALDSFPGALGQVLVNLIENAVVHGYGNGSNDANNANGTDDIVAISARVHAPGQVVLEVRDRGAGVDARHLDRVFDPFFTTRLGQGGSGLGLNIVHNLVHGVLGGSVEIDSQLGQGTCMRLSLPIKAPENQSATEILPA